MLVTSFLHDLLWFVYKDICHIVISEGLFQLHFRSALMLLCRTVVRSSFSKVRNVLLLNWGALQLYYPRHPNLLGGGSDCRESERDKQYLPKIAYHVTESAQWSSTSLN